MSTRIKAISVVVIVTALLVSVVYYWLHREQQKREMRETVTTWVIGAGIELRTELNAERATDPVTEKNALALLDARVDTIAKNLAALRALDSSLQPVLVEFATRYLLVTQEILRLHASSQRHRLATTAALSDLWEFIGTRYSARAGWTTEAVRRKDLLEREYFQYRNTSEALVRLLESYPKDRASLAPHFDVNQMPDESITQAARTRVLEESKLMAAEMERLRKLPRQ